MSSKWGPLLSIWASFWHPFLAPVLDVLFECSYVAFGLHFDAPMLLEACVFLMQMHVPIFVPPRVFGSLFAHFWAQLEASEAAFWP